MARSSKSAKLDKESIIYLAKRTISEFLRDGGTDQAAKLTYFMVLAVAPTLLAVFSLAALLLSDIQEQIAAVISDAITSASGGMDVQGAVNSTLDSLMGSTAGGTVGLIIGIATALWSASAYVKAFSRAQNEMYGVPEGRGIVKNTLIMLGVTLVVILGIFAALIALLLSESIVDALLAPIAGPLGIQGAITFLTGTFLPIWAWVKWPVIVALLFVVVSVLYWATPNVAKPFRIISPGGVLAIAGIAFAGVAISIYMSTVASYSSYGAIGGIMAVLFALWVMNIVIVLGAELDAEYERVKELRLGRPAERHLSLGMRDDAAAKAADEKQEKVILAGREIRLRNLHNNTEAYTAPETRLGTAGDARNHSFDDHSSDARKDAKAEKIEEERTTDASDDRA